MTAKFRNQDGLLARVNFPLYCVEMLTSRHALVAGGGGPSKTGIANGFEIFEINHNGKHFVAEEVIRHETGPNVVMNCAAYSDNHRTYLVSGQESHCQLYMVESVIQDSKVKDENSSRNSVKQRKGRGGENHSNTCGKSDFENFKSRRLNFKIRPSDSIQTDFSKSEPLQKVVRISANGHFMATAGVDGHVRIWKFPQLKKLVDIAAHSKEVDDIDFNQQETELISLSRDGTAVIWNVRTGKKIHDLKWPVPENAKYVYKRCRYGIVEENKEQSRLFILTNPVSQASKLSAYLQLWDPQEKTLKKVVSFDENVASLAVRDDGRFVAVGTMFSGSVEIFIAFSLQRVLCVRGAHNMFITGLEFIPVTSEKHCVTSTAEAAVISISVDNRVCIHTLQYRHSIPSWFAIVLIVLTLFFTFAFCSYVGL